MQMYIPFPSVVNTSDTARRESEPEASRGMFRHHHGIGFPLTYTSCEESQERRSAWGYLHFH